MFVNGKKAIELMRMLGKVPFLGHIMGNGAEITAKFLAFGAAYLSMDKDFDGLDGHSRVLRNTKNH